MSDFLRFIKGSTRSRGYCNAFWKIWVISLKCNTVLAQWSSTRDTRAKKLTKTGDFFGRHFLEFSSFNFTEKFVIVVERFLIAEKMYAKSKRALECWVSYVNELRNHKVRWVGWNELWNHKVRWVRWNELWNYEVRWVR